MKKLKIEIILLTYLIVLLVPMTISMILGYVEFSVIYTIVVGTVSTIILLTILIVDDVKTQRQRKAREEEINILLESIRHNSKVRTRYTQRCLCAKDKK